MEPNCLLQIKVVIGYNVDQNIIKKFKNNKIRANICGIQILARSILITRGPWGHIAHLSNNGRSKDIVPYGPSVE